MIVLNHIPSFAAIAALLSDLTKKKVLEQVHWKNTQGKAFLSLSKRLLQRLMVLQLLDHTKLLYAQML